MLAEVLSQTPAPLGCCSFDLPAIGARFWVAWTAEGLCEGHFSPADAPYGDGAPPELPLPARYGALARYFAGEAVDLGTLAVDVAGTTFQHRVWWALRAIPHGRVRTYSGIAADIGAPRAMRAVGSANGRNPLPVVIPCHRVVQAGHGLGGYSGGLDRKRYLLTLEGATIDADRVRPGQLQLI